MANKQPVVLNRELQESKASQVIEAQTSELSSNGQSKAVQNKAFQNRVEYKK